MKLERPRPFRTMSWSGPDLRGQKPLRTRLYLAYGRCCGASAVSPTVEKGDGELMKTRVRSHLARIVVAGVAALALLTALLGNPAHSRGAAVAGNPSSNVAVVPGYQPAPYTTGSMPLLPVGLKMYSQYHFTPLSPGAVTTAGLKNYDTVILYGIRWSDIPSAGQAAINAFAATHKVIIWDADATGPQNYSGFVHPFSTLASGQSQGQSRQSVVYFLQSGDFLASSNSKSPYYLDPTQLVRDRDELNDMNAMQSVTPNWRPALLAANTAIPNAAWPIAWSYGVIGDHTGMTIYSGLDADAFPTNETLNNDRKELALELAAPIRSTPDAACSPHCQLGSSLQTQPFTSCNVLNPSPHWPHGHIPLVVETSDAANITAQIVTHSGRVLATGPSLTQTGGQVPLVIPTAKLPNGTSRLLAQVLVRGAKACTNPFQLTKQNNARPRLLLLATSHDPIVHEPDQADLLTLRVSEPSSLTIVAQNVHWRRTWRIPGSKVVQHKLPVRVRKAKLILRDRAGNRVTRSLGWG